MKHAILGIMMLALVFLALHAAPQNSDAQQPRYAGDKLVRPENYREWIFLSSGLGMSYNPSANEDEMFTNVFVPQWSYREFLATGKWPDKPMLLLKHRLSDTKRSTNTPGHFI